MMYVLDVSNNVRATSVRYLLLEQSSVIYVLLLDEAAYIMTIKCDLLLNNNSDQHFNFSAYND
jgi:hypothetical protein